MRTILPLCALRTSTRQLKRSRHRRSRRTRDLVGSLVVFSVLTASAPVSLAMDTAVAKHASICERIRHINQATPLGIASLAVEERASEALPPDGIYRYVGVDIDDDGKADDVTHTCTRGGSSMRSDPCTLTARMSRSGRVFTLTEESMFLFKLGKKYFIASSRSVDGSVFGTNIHELNRSGIKLICNQR